MAGDVKNKQFMENEVKPMVRTRVPELEKRIERLEFAIKNLTKAKAAMPKAAK